MEGGRVHSQGLRTVPSGRTTCEAGGLPSTYASAAIEPDCTDGTPILTDNLACVLPTPTVVFFWHPSPTALITVLLLRLPFPPTFQPPTPHTLLFSSVISCLDIHHPSSGNFAIRCLTHKVLNLNTHNTAQTKSQQPLSSICLRATGRQAIRRPSQCTPAPGLGTASKLDTDRQGGAARWGHTTPTLVVSPTDPGERGATPRGSHRTECATPGVTAGGEGRWMAFAPPPWRAKASAWPAPTTPPC